MKDIEEKSITKIIIQYLEKTYRPTTIFIYGSYKDGSSDRTSDFDCLIIVDKKDKSHDNSIINGVLLDCFIYTKEEIHNKNIELFLPLYDALIIKDNGLGKNLKNKVRKSLDAISETSEEEKIFLKNWIKKCIQRIQKEDDEGNFRAIYLLANSLEIYFQLRNMPYLGPKKSIYFLKKEDTEAYEFFSNALKSKNNEDIILWANFLINL